MKTFAEHLKQDIYYTPADSIGADPNYNEILTFIFMDDYYLIKDYESHDHNSLIANNLEYFISYFKNKNINYSNNHILNMRWNGIIYQYALLGRAVLHTKNNEDKNDEDDYFLISFWNENKEIYDRLLLKCIEEITSHFNLPSTEINCYVSTPIHVPNTFKTIEISQKTSKSKMGEKLILHLLDPITKKREFQKLGYRPSEKLTWSRAARQLGMTYDPRLQGDNTYYKGNIIY